MRNLFPIKNPDISEVEKSAHYEILARHSNAISRGPHDIGTALSVKHAINTGQAYPSKASLHRMSPVKRAEIREEVQAMLDHDVIEASNSPWAANVVLVHKKDGGRRFCVDYRALNLVTKKDSYPLPRPDDILDALTGATYFSHFDLVRGYWQFLVEENDREKTAFSTSDGHYQFTKCHSD